jgi:hypothetical protein
MIAIFLHALHITVVPPNSSRPPSLLQEAKDLMLHDIVLTSKI